MSSTLKISEETIIQDRINLGSKLKGMRELRGISTLELSSISNIDHSIIEKMEGGKDAYNVNFLILYSICLGIEITAQFKS